MREDLPLDKNYRPIMIGDILKVFHFIGARRKKHFMYKQVVRIETLANAEFYRIKHLQNPENKDDGYWMEIKKELHQNVEIIQSYTDYFEDSRKSKW